MHLQAGMVAPHFQTVDIFGNQIDLAAYRGKHLLLSFFRNAACALCNLRVHTLIERYPHFQSANLEIVAIFESSAASMLQYVAKQDAPFPLIADPAAHLYTLYGVESSEAKVAATMAMAATPAKVGEAAAQGFHLTQEAGSNFIRMPADFLIDSDGRILAAHYAEYVWDHLSTTHIEELIDQKVPS